MKHFITFEGCEGVGKSTQIRFLAEYLTTQGIRVTATREPGGTYIADKIRSVILDKEDAMSALCEAHLFAAARAEHIDKVIAPALERDDIVLCDRYLDSSFAYQGYARGLGFERVAEINRYALETCMPSATVFIDLPPRDSWRKRKGTLIENDRMENETPEFHEAVYEGFKKLCIMYPERFIIITPSMDKYETSLLIIAALRERGLIE